MTIDVLYLSWNRREFAKQTFDALAANTNWDLVRNLIVYEDGSEDGTRKYLDGAISDLRRDAGVNASLSYVGYRSPVKVMNHYLDREPADLFAKIDSDIGCPTGWLDALLEVMTKNPQLELLGMQAGMAAPPPIGSVVEYDYQPATHIGGVGLMRSSAFLSRERPKANGRFGFTGWQQKHEPTLGWITPDLRCPQLDLIPLEPYVSLSARYVEEGWQRHWPPYHPDATWIWEWLIDRQTA